MSSENRPTCATCPCWVPNDPVKLEAGGACRNSGPQALLVGFNTNAMTKQPDLRKPMLIAAWPPTGPLDWCFAHPAARAEMLRMPAGRKPIPIIEKKPLPEPVPDVVES